MKKTVLITGASRGIGKASALVFAQKGYNVVINYKGNKEKAVELDDYIKSHFRDIETMVIRADVSNETDVKDMISTVIKDWRCIDVLVNNAGIVIDKEFEDRTVTDFKRTLETNLIGTFLVSKYIAPYMLKKKHGKIINVSSTNAFNAFSPYSIDYDASKAGVVSLTKNMALQFAPYLNVNAVAPGWVDTDMNNELPSSLIQEEKEKIYLKRFATPEEIAKVIVFLASDDASYINGEVIKIDGGYK